MWVSIFIVRHLLPLGEGRDEGQVYCPHPNPLPVGEGVYGSVIV